MASLGVCPKCLCLLFRQITISYFRGNEVLWKYKPYCPLFYLSNIYSEVFIYGKA